MAKSKDKDSFLSRYAKDPFLDIRRLMPNVPQKKRGTAQAAPSKAKTMTTSAGYGGSAMDKPQSEPVKSAKMAAPAPVVKKKPVTAPMRKPSTPKAPKKKADSGFDFAGAIRRGMGSGGVSDPTGYLAREGGYGSGKKKRT